MHFLILENGNIINIQEILYVHLSKTEECAYVYVKHLMHASDDYTENFGNIAKRIKITLKDYDRLTSIIR